MAYYSQATWSVSLFLEAELILFNMTHCSAFKIQGEIIFKIIYGKNAALLDIKD